MFKEMNPLTSPKYASYEKNREKYKHWFIDNQAIFDDLNIMRYWCEDNQTDLDTFKKTFVNRFNILASRTKIPKIN